MTQLTRPQKDKIKTIIGECEICGKRERHRLTSLVQMLDSDWKLIIEELSEVDENVKDPILDQIKDIRKATKNIKDFLGIIEVPTNGGRLQTHRIKRQGPYKLRNIQIICKECHSAIHYNERGHINK